MRVAWFRPTLPDAAHRLDDSAALIAELRSTYEIAIVTEASAHDFVWQHFRRPYDLCVFELDNTVAHQFIWPYLLHYGGVLMLRTLTFSDSRADALVREGREADFRAEVTFNGGWRLLRVPLMASRLAVVPHAATADVLQEDYPEARVRYAPTGVHEVQQVQRADGAAVTFGLLSGAIEVAQRAMRRACDAGAAAVLLTDPSPEHVLHAADVVLALRWPTFGEPHTPALAGMAAGKPVVVLETETAADWPALDPQTWQPRGLAGERAAVVSIDPRDEEHSLMLAIRGLSADRALRDQLAAAAFDWWRAHATVRHAAEAWQRILAEAATLEPPPRPADWPPHLSADGTEEAREILREIGVSVDFL
jgi:hypothetical protein